MEWLHLNSLEKSLSWLYYISNLTNYSQSQLNKNLSMIIRDSSKILNDFKVLKKPQREISLFVSILKLIIWSKLIELKDVVKHEFSYLRMFGNIIVIQAVVLLFLGEVSLISYQFAKSEALAIRDTPSVS